jgi:flagellar biogenesis protein FliO
VSPTAQYVIQATVTLIGIALLAALLLLANRRWMGPRTRGPMNLLGQLPLDGRRSVYLVEVGATVYVLGATDHGMVKLGEVDRATLPEHLPATSRSFASVLRDALGREPSEHAAPQPERATTDTERVEAERVDRTEARSEDASG